MFKITLQLVTYNSSRYLPLLFLSLREQTFKEWQMIIVDNNSTDSTLLVLREEVFKLEQTTRIIENKENRGFAGGHNQAFKAGEGEYRLLINPDLQLEPDCLEKMLVCVEQHPTAAAIAPRLMKFDPGLKLTDSENGHTTRLDALGLKVYRSRRVLEQYHNQEWLTVAQKLSNSVALQVFGLSGTMVLYRYNILLKMAEQGQVFDESFGSYKEDVDLAFRLQSAGYSSLVALEAVAYHIRASGGLIETGNFSTARNKIRQSTDIQMFSYRNHWFVLCKNEYWQNVLIDFPWIFWYELRKLLYGLFFTRKMLFAAGRDIWRARKELKIKSWQIKNDRARTWRQMREWWA